MRYVKRNRIYGLNAWPKLRVFYESSHVLQQNPSSEADKLSAGQEDPRIIIVFMKDATGPYIEQVQNISISHIGFT
jgi:hypothetical protein